MTCQATSVQRYQVGFVVPFKLYTVDPEDDEETRVPLDLSGATLLEVWFDPPGAPSFIRSAQVVDAPQGEIEYVTASSADLQWLGRWRRQAHVVLPSGEYWSEVLIFDVLDNIGPLLLFREPRAAALELYVPQVAVLQT